MAELTYAAAIRETLRREMRRDPDVFLLGEDIGVYGGAFGVTKGLLDEFGPERVRSTPISEAALVGVATGAALLGLRPVVEIMFMDFLTLAMDQLLNHATKFRYVYGPQARVPLVLRTPAGGGRSYGATHSQSLEAWFLHAPGLKVATPATPADAAKLLRTAIRDDNPVLFVEHKLLYATTGEVPEDPEPEPFGRAAILREGRDVTLVAYSHGTLLALEAARELSGEGIEAEVIDLRTLVPLDTVTVCDSVRKTGRLVTVEEGAYTGGVGAEIVARVCEEAYEYLDAPVRRVAALDVPIPFSPVLERAVLPQAGDIARTVREVLRPA
ncbi:MAG: pyruvate dehydrogenase E1 component subunit beta [Candidatus Binatia bacterium]|nr:MAG: pyruvate dehydrogenase E1 component subunit beta [Candidatus Binatia bacterium]